MLAEYICLCCKSESKAVTTVTLLRRLHSGTIRLSSVPLAAGELKGVACLSIDVFAWFVCGRAAGRGARWRVVVKCVTGGDVTCKLC